MLKHTWTYSACDQYRTCDLCGKRQRRITFGVWVYVILDKSAINKQ